VFKPVFNEDQLLVLNHITLDIEAWLEDTAADPLPEQATQELIDEIRNFSAEGCDYCDEENVNAADNDEPVGYCDDCQIARLVNDTLYREEEDIVILLSEFARSCTPLTSHDVTTREYDLTTSQYSPEQLRRDVMGTYRVYIDSTYDLTSLERDSLIELRRNLAESIRLCKEYRRANSPLLAEEIERQSALRQHLENISPAVIERCDYWDGFVIRDKHQFYTQSLFYINPAQTYHDREHGELPVKQGDFRQGALYVRPGEFAFCTICNSSKWLDSKYWYLDADVREDQEQVALEMLEHDLSHNKVGHRGKLNLARTEELLSLPQSNTWPRSGLLAPTGPAPKFTPQLTPEQLRRKNNGL
jgi:hypothetical protein